VPSQTFLLSAVQPTKPLLHSLGRAYHVPQGHDQAADGGGVMTSGVLGGSEVTGGGVGVTGLQMLGFVVQPMKVTAPLASHRLKSPRPCSAKQSLLKRRAPLHTAEARSYATQPVKPLGHLCSGRSSDMPGQLAEERSMTAGAAEARAKRAAAVVKVKNCMLMMRIK